MHTAYFVTGTDTGIGKTRTSGALIHALRQAGLARVVGMKPVAAGCDWVDEHGDVPGHWLNEDVAAMRAASSLQVPGGFDNPYALPDAVVVEGAGGFIVPLCEPDPDLGGDWVTSADLAQRLNLPIILTVGVRLGCINHALLTQEAILARGLKLVGSPM